VFEFRDPFDASMDYAAIEDELLALELKLAARQAGATAHNKLGVPPPGENPDRTEFTLDCRLIRSWSLVTTVGDQGSTALDLDWRMRY
jgi:hypothetical protein